MLRSLCVLLFQAVVVVVLVEGGVSSGSAEAAAANGGAAAGNGANPGVQNGGQALLARLVQLGGPFLFQPLGNQAAQQLVPIAALQQQFPLGRAGGLANPAAPVQAQAQAQAVRGAPLTLFAVLSQRNAGGDPQGAVLTPGQVQLIPLAGLGDRQVPGAGGLRFRRSTAARLRGTPAPAAKAAREEEEEGEEEEEEESSGMEGKQAA